MKPSVTHTMFGYTHRHAHRVLKNTVCLRFVFYVGFLNILLLKGFTLHHSCSKCFASIFYALSTLCFYCVVLYITQEQSFCANFLQPFQN